MKAVRASEAMAKEAQAKGVRFMGGTKVTGIGISGGRVKEVITEKERIVADNVLICAGYLGAEGRADGRDYFAAFSDGAPVYKDRSARGVERRKKRGRASGAPASGQVDVLSAAWRFLRHRIFTTTSRF